MEKENKPQELTKEVTMSLLKKGAGSLEWRFLCPVYLVGSFMEKYREAGDIDVIMVVTKDRYRRLFGIDDKIHDRVFRFCRKQKLWLEQYVPNFDIDFKVQIEEDFYKKEGNHIKLGSYAEIPE